MIVANRWDDDVVFELFEEKNRLKVWRVGRLGDGKTVYSLMVIVENKEIIYQSKRELRKYKKTEELIKKVREIVGEIA